MWSFLNKVADLQACNFLKKRLQNRCFPVNIAKFLRAPFLQNTSGCCFWTVKGKILEHALKHTYHGQISEKNFSTSLQTDLRDGYAYRSQTEATLLRISVSRPNQVFLTLS